MSSKIEAFWQDRNKKELELDNLYPERCVHIMSLENPARGSTSGTVTQVSNRLGAEYIINNTARIATESEVQAHRDRGASFAARMNAMTQGHRDQTKIFVTLTPRTDGAKQ